METSDAVIVRDELAILPKVVDVSAWAHRVVKANLVIAAPVITVLFTWDIIWILPLPLGVGGHEASTVVVGPQRTPTAARRCLAEGRHQPDPT